jgi:tRNA modification GTPase
VNDSSNTIAAISTPAGEGAISLIRLSGPEAIAVADRIFRGQEKPSQFPSHLQRFGEIVDGDRLVDQVMLSVHRAPASYTGEDLVEISCHGGVLVSARVLQTCLRAGTRAALPGEFTERAFHNGKMDLTQAEAVIDLIRAQTDLALRSATEQLEGRLGQKIRTIRDELIALLAQIDASIDFPEEGITPEQGDKLQTRFDSIRDKMEELLATADQGRILREGVRVVIYGATNAGKSSLLNRLLGQDRAIVSEIPGTTRDTIEELINLRGIPIRLTDTAGLHPSTDELERQGMARTEKSLKTADLLLHIVDRNAPKPLAFREQPAEQNELLLLNKSDLPEHSDWHGCDALRISCLTEDGMHVLEEKILERITSHHLRAESALAINTRHRDCLRRALEALDRAGTALVQASSSEYVAIDLHTALDAVGEVSGTVGVEEILDSVFGQFCIGK